MGLWLIPDYERVKVPLSLCERRPRPRGPRWLAPWDGGSPFWAFAAYLVNEFSIDIPAIHYDLFALVFAGAWLGLRGLR